jgi:flagellin
VTVEKESPLSTLFDKFDFIYRYFWRIIMPTVINTNTSAQYAQDALKVNSKSMSAAMQQLATGNRINQAKDDAAGLSIGQNMTSQVRGLNQAVRNVNDGINLLQTADGALVETSNMLQRMRELAVQSSNATNSASQRVYLNNEFKSLQTEITRIADNTTWNNAKVFGSVAATPLTLTFQAGILSGQTIGVTLSAMDATGLSVNTESLTTFTASQSAITTIDTAIEMVNSGRSAMGATMNQLSYSADNMVNISTNIAASRSTVMDTDYATASATLSKTQIIQQAATAMLAQANQQPQSVLSLIK